MLQLSSQVIVVPLNLGTWFIYFIVEIDLQHAKIHTRIPQWIKISYIFLIYPLKAPRGAQHSINPREWPKRLELTLFITRWDNKRCRTFISVNSVIKLINCLFIHSEGEQDARPRSGVRRGRTSSCLASLLNRTCFWLYYYFISIPPRSRTKQSTVQYSLCIIYFCLHRMTSTATPE